MLLEQEHVVAFGALRLGEGHRLERDDVGLVALQVAEILEGSLELRLVRRFARDEESDDGEAGFASLLDVVALEAAVLFLLAVEVADAAGDRVLDLDRERLGGLGVERRNGDQKHNHRRREHPRPQTENRPLSPRQRSRAGSRQNLIGGGERARVRGQSAIRDVAVSGCPMRDDDRETSRMPPSP